MSEHSNISPTTSEEMRYQDFVNSTQIKQESITVAQYCNILTQVKHEIKTE